MGVVSVQLLVKNTKVSGEKHQSVTKVALLYGYSIREGLEAHKYSVKRYLAEGRERIDSQPRRIDPFSSPEGHLNL